MNVRQLYQYLNENIPTSLSCEWDNDGLMCCPDPDREVHRVLIALDVTGEVADEAVEGDFDVVVSHHPLIFKPIRSLTTDDGVGAKLGKPRKTVLNIRLLFLRLLMKRKVLP